MYKILVIKNGNCDTDIKHLINLIYPLIVIDIILSKDLTDLLCKNVVTTYNGIIILGGYQSLTNRNDEKYEYTYLNNLINYTKYWIENNVNILGICLGAQIIGEANGLKTVKMSTHISGYEYDIEILKDDPILKDGIKDSLKYVLCCHYDCISKPTDQNSDIDIIGIIDKGIPYIFKISKTIYGVQFHPEITRHVFEQISKTFPFNLSTVYFMIENENKILQTSIKFIRNWLDTWILE